MTPMQMAAIDITPPRISITMAMMGDISDDLFEALLRSDAAHSDYLMVLRWGRALGRLHGMTEAQSDAYSRAVAGHAFQLCLANAAREASRRALRL